MLNGLSNPFFLFSRIGGVMVLLLPSFPLDWWPPGLPYSCMHWATITMGVLLLMVNLFLLVLYHIIYSLFHYRLNINYFIMIHDVFSIFLFYYVKTYTAVYLYSLFFFSYLTEGISSWWSGSPQNMLGYLYRSALFCPVM